MGACHATIGLIDCCWARLGHRGECKSKAKLAVHVLIHICVLIRVLVLILIFIHNRTRTRSRAQTQIRLRTQTRTRTQTQIQTRLKLIEATCAFYRRASNSPFGCCSKQLRWLVQMVAGFGGCCELLPVGVDFKRLQLARLFECLTV